MLVTEDHSPRHTQSGKHLNLQHESLKLSLQGEIVSYQKIDTALSVANFVYAKYVKSSAKKPRTNAEQLIKHVIRALYMSPVEHYIEFGNEPALRIKEPGFKSYMQNLEATGYIKILSGFSSNGGSRKGGILATDKLKEILIK